MNWKSLILFQNLTGGPTFIKKKSMEIYGFEKLCYISPKKEGEREREERLNLCHRLASI